MMSLAMFAPLAVSTGLAVVVAAVHRRLPPVAAARLIAAVLMVMAAAAIPTSWILAVGYVAHMPMLGGRFDWCVDALGVHSPIDPWFGVPALVVSAVGFVRARRVLVTYRRLRSGRPGGVEIAEHDTLFAYTLPGRSGHVMLSSALVDLLSDVERDVVVAHEQGHAQFRHDRYLLACELAAAWLPPLRPMATRLRYSLERWADEHAVAVCGDRRLVARTLGKVALSGAVPAAAIGFTGGGVAARVAALLGPPPVPLRSGVLIGVSLLVASSVAFGLVQVHHLAGMITAFCAG
ncbi:MAG: M56 family metallopeptidase [Actinomycetota bacterium]|nr:M56 family metallopeptidase [Actinomycetota bacterium]